MSLFVQRAFLLKRFYLKAFGVCLRILHNKSLLSTSCRRLYPSLIGTRGCTRPKLRPEVAPKQGARRFCTASSTLDDISYHNIADETLDAIAELFEDLGESPSSPTDYDVQLSDGVLTVNLGAGRGIYVINKQSPNKQIWLSSPTSGPKRYDFTSGTWMYAHDGVSLHSLLSSEISGVLGHEVDFTRLTYGAADEL
ncbi:frataxin, mitochondrial-like isoform X1 [Porites lutea]|uniref:frataxin, mitochondrial-like isoform X1 n=1 Tax=Porites lutea TaxID=51062 RepID=UPI003CC62285